MKEDGDTKRRLIMMLTIILAGSAVTFLDLSPVLVILIAVGIGLVMLFALNMVTLEELKDEFSAIKHKLNQPLSLKKDKKSKKPENNEIKAKTEVKAVKDEIKKSGKKKELPFADLIKKIPFFNKKSEEKVKQEIQKDKAAKISLFSGISELIHRKKTSEKKSREIDDLLDKTLNNEFPSTDDITDTESDNDIDSDSSDIEIDEFSEFDNFDLGLEEEESSEISEDMTSGNLEEEIPDSTIADILAKEGIELELDDEEFPSASSNEDETKGKDLSDKGIGDIDELDDDVSGLDLGDDEFGDFDEIDLDELEPEDEIDLGDDEIIEDVEIGTAEDETAGPPVEPVEDEDILSAPPKEWTQTKTSDISMSEDTSVENSISLSTGEDDDDLFAMLKSDTKKAVSVQEQSLVRDLKDATINSEELVEDLEGILRQFGIEKENVNEKENSRDEGDINE